MNSQKIFDTARENIEKLFTDPLDENELWAQFIALHHADIADFLVSIDRQHALHIFSLLTLPMRVEVFSELSSLMQVAFLRRLPEEKKAALLRALPLDEVTDLFEHLSDDQLKRYVNLLHTKDRKKILSLMRFNADSAGRIMTTDVFTLIEDFTVEKSIHLLQRLRPSRDIHQVIYVVNRSNVLVGFINLEDLVLHKASQRINQFMHRIDLQVAADEDQETVAHRMVHYGVMTVPVVDHEDHFLGIIPSDTLVDVIVEEASEDVQRMAALAPLKNPYFETPFFRLFYARCSILVVLLLFGSISSGILHLYETALGGLLLALVPMLTSTGGNASNQTSAMVIRGLSSGEIDHRTMTRFLRREFLMALLMGVVLGVASYARVILTGGSVPESIAVSLSVGLIVITSVVLGSGVPLLLKRLNIDPAFSAGPFLATAMDIFGVVIYCMMVKLVFGYFIP